MYRYEALVPPWLVVCSYAHSRVRLCMCVSIALSLSIPHTLSVAAGMAHPISGTSSDKKQRCGTSRRRGPSVQAGSVTPPALLLDRLTIAVEPTPSLPRGICALVLRHFPSDEPSSAYHLSATSMLRALRSRERLDVSVSASKPSRSRERVRFGTLGRPPYSSQLGRNK